MEGLSRSQTGKVHTSRDKHGGEGGAQLLRSTKATIVLKFFTSPNFFFVNTPIGLISKRT